AYTLQPQRADASEVRVEYGPRPSQQADGWTKLHSAQGVTRFKLGWAGGQARVLTVEGAGCAGCPAPGNQADYDAQGRIVGINGLTLARHPHGGMASLQPAAAGWPGLRFDFRADGLRQGWFSR